MKIKESNLIKASLVVAIVFISLTANYFPKSLSLITAGLSESKFISIALK